MMIRSRSLLLRPSLLLCVVAACLSLNERCHAQATQAIPGPLPSDGPAYPVRAFVLEYVRPNPAHPSIDQLMQIEVPLGFTHQGFVAPREDVPTVRIALGDAVNRGTEPYHASALQKILETLRDHLVARDLIGVYVAPDPMQIDELGRDLRTGNDRSLRLLITTGIVTEIRTLASGERVSERGPILPQDRVNHPLHRRIIERSPIQPMDEAAARASATTRDVRNDLLQRDQLDAYLFHLSRHPGRRVDASVSAAQEPGSVALDYLITENRPLVIYAQLSNTGTRSTDYLRQRFGFVHNQLTNNDDILSFDFITAWFDKANAVLASYERPFADDRFRWRVHGNWSEFAADQVGFFGDDFEGESWALGGELIWNFYQKRELFLDLVTGVRFENIEVDNVGFGISGDVDFIVPHVDLRLDRTTDWHSTQGSIGLEFRLSDADPLDMAALGRTDPDEDTTTLNWGLRHSVYLEPLLNQRAWEDPTTPESSTLAHEVMLAARGQYAFGNRLIPQGQQVVGGLYSVRGYPESAVAGDTVVIGSAEYRYHLPRAFAIESEPRQLFGRTFRYAPQHVYGMPDWDLVLKGFFDIGHTSQSDRLAFERNETLVGAGVGAELLYRRNLNVRLDWGFALDDLEAAGVNRGANRLHFVVTLLF